MWRLLPNSVHVVQYMPAPERFERMHHHETSQTNDDDHLNNDWAKEVAIAYRYEKQRPKFLNMLE